MAPTTSLGRKAEIGQFSIVPEGISNSLAISLYLDSGFDALVLTTEGFFPDSIYEPIQKAIDKEVPVFVLGRDLWEEPARRKVEMSGAVGLPLGHSDLWAFLRGLEKIVSENKGCDRITNAASRMFDRSDFYNKQEFIEFMLNPELKQIADSITGYKGTIVVDCGHIDSSTHLPTRADSLTLEQGIVLAKYLKIKGYDAKLGILFNDMYPFNNAPKREARRANDLLRKQIKNSGSHFGINQVYQGILKSYGITSEEYRNFLVPTLESNLKFAAKQSLDAHGKTTQFDADVTQVGNGFSYSRDSSATPVQISSETTGAPLCNMVSAEQVRKYEELGASMAIFLRDEKWECGIRGGGNAARNIYDVKMPAHAVFYTANGETLIPKKSVRL